MSSTLLKGLLVACLIHGALAAAPDAWAGPSSFTLTTGVVCEGVSATATDPCGTVTPDTTTCKRNCIITLEATPTAGTDWRFDHWEGAASGSGNPTTVRLSADSQATAFFVQDSPGGGGGTPPPQTGREVVGYFIQWGIYRRNYLVKDIVANGAADTLTVINYAFAGIDDRLQCTSLDPFADWGKRFDAAESVDGVADTVAQPLKGNFNQLRKLKQLYPHLRVLIAIGGWNDSERFSDAALPANQAEFVRSCVDMFIKGQLGGDGATPGAGVFDGIDIDWEYPGACGATCDYRAEDKVNYSALLAEFRTQLDQVDPNRHLLLTAATPAAKYHYDLLELAAISTSLDWLNLMTYDFHGAWEPSGPTNHHANLFINDQDPAAPRLSVDQVVGAYLSAGVPAAQIVIGLPFYGRGWGSVRDGGSHGLYQQAGRIPRGTWEQGSEDYKVLMNKGYPLYWDEAAKASWLYNGSEFWTFDSPAAIGAKMDYIADKSLRGVMFWELSGDDGSLVAAIAAGSDSASP
jgi:chitinase